MDKKTCPNCVWEPSDWRHITENTKLGYCAYPLPAFVPRRPITINMKNGDCTYDVIIDGYSTPCYVDPCPAFEPKPPTEEGSHHA